jgi:rod shape-determining protein MreD
VKQFHVVKWATYTIAFIIIFIFQFTPYLLPKIFDISPLLLIPAVICIAMFEGEAVGAVFGIVAGILWDSQSGRVFGFNCLFLMIFGIIIGLLIQYLFHNTVVSALLFTLLATVILELITWYFFYSIYGDNQIVFALLQVILPTTIYTLLLSIPIYIGFRKLNKILETDSSIY